jgi:dTDP-4-dehydrorhamnose reductase
MDRDGRRWLILGGLGKLGAALNRLDPTPGAELVFMGRAECDIQSPVSVERALSRVEPAVVVNCAAWTDVDAAEVERHGAWRVNAVGPAVVASQIKKSGSDALLIHVSTDYVFSGEGKHGQPLSEAVDPYPLSSYGRSKLAGEEALRALMPESSLIVRTSWLFGPDGADFVGRVRHSARSGRPIEVVEDQWGSPTLVDDLASSLSRIASIGRRGGIDTAVLHVANSGFASRYELARSVYALTGRDPDLVKPVVTRNDDTTAVRPSWSALTSVHLCDLDLPALRPWEEALAALLDG